MTQAPNPTTRRAAFVPVFFAALALGIAAFPAAIAQPTLTTHVDGYTDVNGNGLLDCGEPVAITTTFATNNSATPALTGTLDLPAAGSAGLVYQAGSLTIDPELTNGCTGQITEGNVAGDPAATIDFACPADPPDSNAWTLVVHYRALYSNTAAPSLTATAAATTSDGNAYRATDSLPASTTCTGAPNALAVTKTAAGPATPGSVLLYTLTATDTSGLGAGGVQLVDVVPDHTTFDAAASSSGWLCTPDAHAGSLCRTSLGNLSPSASASRYFAVALDATFPPPPFAIANTGCARLGPDTVAGCASVSTPAAGTPVLHLAKTLAAGSAAPGATLTYSLAAANTGNQGLSDAFLEETVPPHTTFAAGASSAGWTCTPGPSPGATCVLDLGPLAAGANLSRTFSVVVDNPLPPLAPGAALDNTACLSVDVGTAQRASAPVGPGGMRRAGDRGRVLSTFPARNDHFLPISSQAFAKTTERFANAPGTASGIASACSSVSTPTTGMPVLHLVKSVLSGTATPGATLAYDLAVQNSGNEGAAALLLTETVPANTTFATAASSPGWTCTNPAAGGTCILTTGALAAATTLHRTFAVALDQPLAAGVATLANTACAAIAQAAESARHRTTRALPISTSATDPACDTLLTPTLGHPRLALTKTYTGGPVQAGGLLVFQLAASNSGDQDASATTLTETVPAHTTFAPADSTPGWVCSPGPAAGSSCTLPIGILAAGATATTFTFAVRADTPLPATVKQIPNAACLATADGLSACDQANTPPAVTLVADLAYRFQRDTNRNGLADPGDVLTYTLTVTNTTAGTVSAGNPTNPGSPSGTATAVHLVTILDSHLALLAGSVSTSAGTITAGNAPTDAQPIVDIPSLAPGGTVTVTFQATVAPILPLGLKQLASQTHITAADVAPTVSSDPTNPIPLSPTTTPVGAPVVASIPTLGPSALLLLGGVLGALAFRRLRRLQRPLPAR